MAKRRAELKIDVVADYGPCVKRRGDGRMIYTGAADVILEDRPDPSITDRVQLVHGGRRNVCIEEMYRRGLITKPMQDAVKQFLDDCSDAVGGSGSSSGNLLSDGIRTAPGSRIGTSEKQSKAMREVDAVWNLLGINDHTVFWWVIFGNKTTAEFDRWFKLREGTGAKWFRLSLQALDDHYNPRWPTTERDAV